MKVRFLLDENLSPRLQIGLWRRNPAIDVLRVGDLGAPALGTLDPEILLYLASAQRLLVTNNRVSMPDHLQVHHAAGGHHWGITWIRPGAQIGQLVDALELIWTATDAEEWQDSLEWIPF
jgi:predicted nuclease of predicted toxin-antitoxin system